MYRFADSNSSLKYITKPFYERIDMYKKLIDKHKKVVIIVPRKENIWLYKEIFKTYNTLEYHSSIVGKKRLDTITTVQKSSHYVLISTLIGMYIPLPNDVIVIIDDAQSNAYNDSHSPFLDARTTFTIPSQTLSIRTVIASTMPFIDVMDGIQSLDIHSDILDYPHYYDIKPPYNLSETVHNILSEYKKQLHNWFITMPINDDTDALKTYYTLKTYDTISSPDALKKPPKAILCILSGNTIYQYTRIIELTERAMYHKIPIHIIYNYSEKSVLLDTYRAEMNDAKELLEAPYGIFCTIRIPKKKYEYYKKQLLLALLEYKNIEIYKEYNDDTYAIIILKSDNEELLYAVRMQFYEIYDMLWKRGL